MNLNPANQLSLYGHRSEFCNFIEPWLQASEDKLVVLEEFFAWLAGQDDIAVMPFGEVVNAMESQ